MSGTGISEAVIRAANTKTVFGADAILPVETGTQFIRRIIDGAPTLKLIREVQISGAPSRKTPKIIASRRMLRSGSENVAPTDQQPFSTSYVTLTPQQLDVAYEVSYQLARDSIERQQLLQTLSQLTEQRIATDLNDLVWNGDTTDYSGASTTLNGSHSSSVATITVAATSGFPSASGGYGFLVVESERIEYTGVTSTTFTGATRGADGTTAASHSNGTAVTFIQDALYPAFDGVRALITATGNLSDLSGVGDGSISLDTFESLMDLVPAKYRNSTQMMEAYRWSANDLTIRRWLRHLSARQDNLGAVANVTTMPEAAAPLGIKWNRDEHVPTGTIVLAPMNGILLGVRTDNIRRYRTMEGKDLVSRGATYFKWSLEAQVQLDEEEACAIGTGLVTTI